MDKLQELLRTGRQELEARQAKEKAAFDKRWRALQQVVSMFVPTDALAWLKMHKGDWTPTATEHYPSIEAPGLAEIRLRVKAKPAQDAWEVRAWDIDPKAYGHFAVVPPHSPNRKHWKVVNSLPLALALAEELMRFQVPEEIDVPTDIMVESPESRLLSALEQWWHQKWLEYRNVSS